jgi:RimJ/RimL family protein N-acetyltransferase
VLPALRGRGYIDDLVAETTRFHAARGEPRISATTDTTNQPMAAAFRRAGYQETGIRYVFMAPAAAPG